MCSPIVRASKSNFFFLNDLRVTGVDCKKATRPCNCGFLGEARCRCTPDQISRYRARISGPLLDRIDMQIDVPAVPIDELGKRSSGEPSNDIRIRVAAARNRMLVRQGKPNAMLESNEVDRHCVADTDGILMLRRAISKLGLSARSYHRTLKVARSIADLAGSEQIVSTHVAEALGYRRRLTKDLAPEPLR